ncbi:MAG: ATP-dependent DNA helicase [bacterium]
MDSIDYVLGRGGLINKGIGDSYEYRSQQIRYAKKAQQALQEKRNAILEGETGTGKSLGYLIPSTVFINQGRKKKNNLQLVDTNKRRIVISTATTALQHQLLEKDIPALQRSLDGYMSIKAIVVKGRGNYICRREMKQLEKNGLFETKEDVAAFQRLKDWVKLTKVGGKNEAPDNTLPLWSKVCSSSKTCEYGNCSHKTTDCFVYKMRKEQENADIILVNHALFMTDLKLRLEQGEEKGLLIKYDGVVFDEAHHLESVITNVFGDQVSVSGTKNIMGEIRNLYKYIMEQGPQQTKGSARNELAKLEKFKEIANDFWEYVSTVVPKRGTKPLFTNRGNPWSGLQKDMFIKFLKGSLVPMYNSLTAMAKEVSIENVSQDVELEDLERRIKAALKKIAGLGSSFSSLCKRRWGNDYAYWLENTGNKYNQYVFNAAPIKVDTFLTEDLFGTVDSVILTSATLSTNNNFDYLIKKLGIPKEGLITDIIEAPFNYKEQALICVPQNAMGASKATPTQNPTKYEQYLEYTAKNIIKITTGINGGVFALFTSYRNMNDVYNIITESNKLKDYHILVQGVKRKQQMLKEFVEYDKCLLLGTSSFWEGVDIVGEDLSCVIIDKIPFSVPTDPIIKARQEKMGRQFFSNYILPEAIIKLKQGFGRLIRSKEDHGAVVFLDGRVATENYGKEIISSLPEARYTRNVQEVIEVINKQKKVIELQLLKEKTS